MQRNRTSHENDPSGSPPSRNCAQVTKTGRSDIEPSIFGVRDIYVGTCWGGEDLSAGVACAEEEGTEYIDEKMTPSRDLGRCVACAYTNVSQM